jgi:hypothetical protein
LTGVSVPYISGLINCPDVHMAGRAHACTKENNSQQAWHSATLDEGVTSVRSLGACVGLEVIVELARHGVAVKLAAHVAGAARLVGAAAWDAHAADALAALAFAPVEARAHRAPARVAVALPAVRSSGARHCQGARQGGAGRAGGGREAERGRAEVEERGEAGVALGACIFAESRQVGARLPFRVAVVGCG